MTKSTFFYINFSLFRIYLLVLTINPYYHDIQYYLLTIKHYTMKKFFPLFVLLLCSSLFASCIGEEENNTVTGIEDDGTGRIPSQSELIGTWQSNNYQGWEPRLEQDVVIARGLTLNADGTYENKYRGHLTQTKDGSSLSTTEFGEWEIETGEWSYNSTTGEITYNPKSDKRVNYETMVMESYTLEPYNEKCLLKESGTYKNGWITLDTYLKRAGNKGDLRYVIYRQ